MPSELWEIVRADKLKAGDVIRAGLDDYEPYTVEGAWELTGDYVLVKGDYRDVPDEYYSSELLLRRYTGPSLEVLMRAMRLMHFALYDEKIHVPMAGDPQNYIRQAQAEIEREKNDQA